VVVAVMYFTAGFAASFASTLAGSSITSMTAAASAGFLTGAAYATGYVLGAAAAGALTGFASGFTAATLNGASASEAVQVGLKCAQSSAEHSAREGILDLIFPGASSLKGIDALGVAAVRAVWSAGLSGKKDQNEIFKDMAVAVGCAAFAQYSDAVSDWGSEQYHKVFGKGSDEPSALQVLVGQIKGCASALSGDGEHFWGDVYAHLDSTQWNVNKTHVADIGISIFNDVVATLEGKPTWIRSLISSPFISAALQAEAQANSWPRVGVPVTGGMMAW